MFGLPFDSGHVLALRVFPENDFAPYTTVWHQDPAGHWSIYVDGPRLDIACPRYYGATCTNIAHAGIGVEWTGPTSVRVTMDDPNLDWTVTATEPLRLRALNRAGSRLRLWTWRSAPLLRARELLAQSVLGLCEIRMSGTMPSGHVGVLMPQRMYFIDESTGLLDGLDLGQPMRRSPNPRIGDVPLPARGVLAVGGAAWDILDHDEHRRTRAETQT